MSRLVEARWFVGRAVRMIARRATDPTRIRRYVESHDVRKLQIGAGPNILPGWLNTDLLPDFYPEHRRRVVRLDALKPFPFGDETFDYVFSEHQIEHVTEPEAQRLLAECCRILRPGGRIRIATPDLAAILRLYDEELGEVEEEYVAWVLERFHPEVRSGNRACYVVNQMLNGHGHRFVYDEVTLAALLVGAGFGGVRRYAAGESDDPELRGLEAHGRAIGSEAANRLETMVLEAVRG
jgi:predicted SAM-dependent methyltransferase